jgi:hypothetical protein
MPGSKYQYLLFNGTASCQLNQLRAFGTGRISRRFAPGIIPAI